MSDAIISAPLAKPPREANRLSSKDNLLVVWRRGGNVIGEDNTEYHFAVHFPVWGWLGYRWNEEYGAPQQILPATQDTVWVNTHPYWLMHLQMKQNSEAAITNTRVEVVDLLHSNARGCLVKTRNSIEYLRDRKGNGRLSRIKLYDDSIDIFWAHFLSDGAIVACDYERLIVLSPEGRPLHEENGMYCDNHPPFIIREEDDHHLYYTDDPRKGWRKSNALNVIRKQIGENSEIKFFTILGDDCYMAVKESDCFFHLYRFSSGCTDHVEHVWGIDSDEWDPDIALYSRLICITSPVRLFSHGSTDIPENNGFLAWDPITNTFHTDIPRTTNIQRISTGRIKTINIPSIWGKNAPQR